VSRLTREVEKGVRVLALELKNGPNLPEEFMEECYLLISEVDIYFKE